MATRKSAVSRKAKAGSSTGGLVVVERSAKTGRFTTVKSVRSIERNSQKYSSVLERLAKK